MDELNFVDYTVILVSVIVAGLVSLYYGLPRGQTPSDQKIVLGVFPISMSITASILSGTSMIGLPSDAYLYGLDWGVFFSLSFVASAVLNHYFFLPILFNLRIDSAYEYLEIRFDARLRKLSSFMYIVVQIGQAAIGIYSAGVVIKQFSNVSTDFAAQGLAILCALSAAIGGFKGVVWTDTYQAIIMWICFIGFFGISYVQGGGLLKIYELARDSGRLVIFETNLDPTVRLSVWSGVLGNAVTSCATTCLSPANFQRYSALESEAKARKVSYISGCQTGFIVLLLSVCGLSMYSHFHGCDPKLAGIVDDYMYSVVHFIGEGSKIVGLKGLLIAGVVSASLSTMSTCINTSATLIHTEFTKNLRFFGLNESLRIRLLTIVSGALVMAFLVLIRGATSVFEIYLRLLGAAIGQIVGLFILGMFCLSANSQGSFWGGVLSLSLMSCLSLGSKMSGVNFASPLHYKTLSTEQCPFNVTIPKAEVTQSDHIPSVFRITPYYYPAMASMATIVTGLVISRLTRRPSDKIKLKRALFCPLIQRAFKNSFYREVAQEENSPGDLECR